MLIAHTTAFGGADESAFVHAVALAARSGARLTSVHVRTGEEELAEPPRAGDLLRRWGLPEAAVEHTHVSSAVACDDVVEALLDLLQPLGADLVVASTHPRSPLRRLFLGSVAEGMARNLRAPTLLLPAGCRGLVQPATGEIGLRRVLLPAASTEDAERAGLALALFAHLAKLSAGEVVLLHAGGVGSVSTPALPSGFVLTEHTRSAAVDAAIVGAARGFDADLIVMATRGHDAPGDVLWGSHTERVLHGAGRPLLWVPAGTVVLGP